MRNMLITSIVVAISAASATPVLAQARTNITSLTCGQAKSLIDRRGAAVITTGRHTYERYVKNRNFCEIGDRTRRQSVKTKNSNSCFIGFRCITPRSTGN